MSRFRVYVVAFAAVAGTLGIPTHVAASAVPAARGASVTVAGAIGRGSHVHAALDPAFTVNLLAVSFAAPTPDGVHLRARALHDGVWSPWTELEVEDTEGADGAEAARSKGRQFSSPLWVGQPDRVEVAVTGERGARATAVRAHLYNTLGEPAKGPRAVFGALGRFLTATAPAYAHPNKPPIISRREWGADESIGDAGPGAARALRLAFVHHTAGTNSYSRSQSAAIVRAIHRYHVKARDFSDIGYNFLVDRYGQIFEGRRGGIERAVIGAHTMGFNTGSTGVSLMGTFSSASPPSAMLRALKKLLAWKLDVHHVPPVGKVTMVSAGNPKYDKGERVSFHRISAHRDGTSTSCPGYQVYRRLGWLRDEVNAGGRPKIYLPSQSSSVLRRDGDGVNETLTVKATFSQTVDWRLRFFDPGQSLVHTMSGRASSLKATWKGVSSSGARVPTGRYTWRLDIATTSTRHPGTPAFGALYVVNGHPTGTLLQDSYGLYYVDGRTRRPVDPVARAALLGTLPAVRTGPWERGWYRAGAPLELRNGALLSDAAGARYIFSAGTLRRFAFDPNANPPVDTFSALGYRSSALIAATDQYLAALPPGPTVEDATVHPSGTALRDTITGNQWVTGSGTKRSISTLSRATQYREAEVVAPTEGDRTLLEIDPSPFPVRPGAVVSAPDGGRPWLLDGGKKRRFRSWTMFSGMGYRSSMLITGISQAELDAVPTGPTYT